MTKWQWFAGYGKNPERFNIGPHNSRDEVVAEINRDYLGELFTIVEANKGRYCYRIFDTDRFFEDLDEANAERLDGDGDGRVIDEVTPDQERDLENMVNDAIEAWVAKHGLEETPWAFEETRNEELYIAQPKETAE
jgi:hypothetical protein